MDAVHATHQIGRFHSPLAHRLREPGSLLKPSGWDKRWIHLFKRYNLYILPLSSMSRTLLVGLRNLVSSMVLMIRSKRSSSSDAQGPQDPCGWMRRNTTILLRHQKPLCFIPHHRRSMLRRRSFEMGVGRMDNPFIALKACCLFSLTNHRWACRETRQDQDGGTTYSANGHVSLILSASQNWEIMDHAWIASSATRPNGGHW